MIKLNVGSPTKTKAPPVNTFELVITAMSGDGDHEGTSSEFGDHDHIIKYVELINAVAALSWNARCDESPIYPALKAKAEELGMDKDEVVDWYYDMVGPNLIYEGRRAMLVGVDVFWYDVNGKKFEVDVEGLINPC